MAKNKTPGTPFDPEIKKGLVIALVIILLFGSGNFLGGMFSKNKVIESDSTTKAAQTTAASASAASQAPSSQPQTTAAPASSAAPAQEQTTAAPAANDQTSAPAQNAGEQTTAASAAQPSTGAPTTKADIVKLFNESANKIKTGASKVTRNYQDYQHNEDKTVLPQALSGIGKPLISKFLTKNETPLELTGADITAQYPVAGESFVSNTTEADLADATCTDDGTSYNIVLKFNECTDPVGTGCANAFTLIKEADVKGNAPVVQSFSCRLYDGQIECKIDKATGNMTWARYTLPMVLSVTAKVLVTVNASVGMTFIDDYTITY